MRNLLLIGFLLLIVTGCTVDNNKSSSDLNLPNVYVDITQAINYNYFDLVDSTSLSYIQLETKPESLVGEIDRLYVKDGYILCISNKKLIVFNDIGKYIYSISNKGKGPGEYQTLDDVILENDTLFLLDRVGKKVMKYSVQGEFIESMYTGLHSSSFIKTKDNYYCFYVNSERTNNSDYRLNYFSESNRHIFYKKDHISDKEYKWRYFLSINNFFSKEDTVFVNFPCNDTIYSLTDNKIEPYQYIDWGKSKLPKGTLYGNFKDVEDFYYLHGKDYIYSTLGIFCNDSHLSFGFRLQNNLYQVLYDYNTKKTKIISSINDPYDVAGESLINFSLLPQACDSRFFYVVIEQSDFTDVTKKQGDMPEVFINTDISKNPIIAKFKYKL